MYGPSLVAWLLVVLSAMAALSCLLRDGPRTEALTGAGMAAMAVPMTVLDPGPWGATIFAAVFTTAAVRALVGCTPHRLHHTVCSGAMVYMAVAMAAAGPAHAEHAAHLSAGIPLLTGLLLLYFAGYVLRTGLALVPGTAMAAGAAGGGTVRLWHAPEVAAACRVTMALGMLAMLLAL